MWEHANIQGLKFAEKGHDDPSPCLYRVFEQFGDGNEVFFRIKRSTQLKKLMNAYCDRQSVDFNSIAFLFDGRRLRAEQTPDELEMEDGDEIDAMLHQTGGSLS
uniref:Small ubiquitin-related modifier n=1 Tax=Solanum lycopersicum TaxID=4081 RepID=A0A3Q7HFJ5_SOLLC